MHKKYTIQSDTVDRTITSQKLSLGTDRGYACITFYTDSTKQTQVTPTAGTVTITISENGHNFGDIQNGVIDVSKAKYPRPNFQSPAKYVKCECSGVTGAGWYVLEVNMYGG